MKKKRNNKGFTLAELLIVVAIIGVLVAISIPIFNAQLEKAKQATDLSNMRSAKAAAIADWMSNGMVGDYERYYDASKGMMTDDAPSGYGRSSKNVRSFDTVLDGASGIPNSDGTPNYITVSIDSNGDALLSWGGGKLATWSKISGIEMDADIWWNDNEARKAAFNKLRETDNSIRKKADIEILNSLAETFNGKTVEEMESILGETRFDEESRTGKTMIFAYGKDGGGSVYINNIDTNNLAYMSEAGYDTRIYNTSTTSAWQEVNNFELGNNYVKTFLFSSDEMIGTVYNGNGSNVNHNIRIKYDVENGKVKNAAVWVEGLQNQGYKSDQY